MAEAVGEAGLGSLEKFLDTLPRKPCDDEPRNKYYCTVCERLNKPVASRCKYSSVEPLPGSAGVGESGKGTLEFIEVSDDLAHPDQASDKEKIEFKIVAPVKSDDDFPMIELIQPKDKKIEPIEMELLEDVAIDFEISEDEPVEVEVLEVVPIEDDEDEDLDTGETEEGAEPAPGEPTGAEGVEFVALEVVEVVEETEEPEAPEEGSDEEPKTMDPSTGPGPTPTIIPSVTPSTSPAPAPEPGQPQPEQVEEEEAPIQFTPIKELPFGQPELQDQPETTPKPKLKSKPKPKHKRKKVVKRTQDTVDEGDQEQDAQESPKPRVISTPPSDGDGDTAHKKTPTPKITPVPKVTKSAETGKEGEHKKPKLRVVKKS